MLSGGACPSWKGRRIEVYKDQQIQCLGGNRHPAILMLVVTGIGVTLHCRSVGTLQGLD